MQFAARPCASTILTGVFLRYERVDKNHLFSTFTDTQAVRTTPLARGSMLDRAKEPWRFYYALDFELRLRAEHHSDASLTYFF